MCGNNSKSNNLRQSGHATAHSKRKRKEGKKSNTGEERSLWRTLIPKPTTHREIPGARSMEKHEIRGEEAPAAPAPAPAPAAVQQLNDHEDGPLQAVAAAAAGEGGGVLRGALALALQQLVDLGDRRLQSASFFLVWGCCMLINATVLNPAANLEHKFVGFVVLTVGAWLALLTLAGAGAGRAAAHAERFLRGLFF